MLQAIRIAKATGGDFKTGALAAGINEALVVHLDALVKGDKNLLSMSSQIIGVLAAASQKDADAKSIEKGGWIAKNATQYNHQLHKSQAEALDEQRKFHPELVDRLNAAACALVSCAASIPVDDKRYAAFKDLQDRGEGYGAEIAILQATGQFEGRTWIERTDDLINANGKSRQAVGAGAEAAAGVAGGVASYVGMAATSPLCVGVITCALPAGLGALGTQSMVGAWESASRITADFRSGEPDRIAASFYPGTFPGESSATGDLAVGAGMTAAQLLLFGAAGKLFGGGLGEGAGKVGPKGVSGSALTRDELISGLPVGTKITPGSVVDIRRLPDGRTVWLEKGTDAAGLQHIYKRHEADFVNKGISRDDIPNAVMSAL